MAAEQHERGKYIVIEGPDGCGKGAQKDRLVAYLRTVGISVTDVHEPGGTPFGEAVRAVLLNSDLERQPESSFDLFTAARRELAAQVIGPALIEGIWVVSDRNWLSSVAYQGFAEGMHPVLVAQRSEEALGAVFIPDATFIIDVPVAVADSRMSQRQGAERDYFERQGTSYFERVHTGYLWAARTYNFEVVDGTPSPDDVHQTIVAKLGGLATREP